MIEFVTKVSENCSALDPADPVGSGEITNLIDSLTEEVYMAARLLMKQQQSSTKREMQSF
ncbi:MAG: hypothetical protein ACLTCQ_23650 [Enterocloster bolteae]